MNLKHKMKAGVSLVDRAGGLGDVKTCQQLCHRELGGMRRMQ